MKLAITSGLIIGMAIILLHALVTIAIYGAIIIKVSSETPYEIALMCGVIMYGIYLFVKGIRRE